MYKSFNEIYKSHAHTDEKLLLIGTAYNWKVLVYQLGTLHHNLPRGDMLSLLVAMYSLISLL